MPYREADQLNTYLFHEGTSRNAYEYMGAHATEVDGVAGLANIVGSELVELFGKKNTAKGIKVRFSEE